ncbi:hypothetical protein GCM10011494_29920 [Novosphingobium endophyticum]|uniref:Sugar transporter n=1 Tax=Novosphingobium endophyticum TaxID=1955250 RepID=A0A916TUX2_9SPHN|nr:hypothetical protein [Novosphingobium endophyticum]GGC09273.1 hypothetical protein GCM10011494_29920 [Novosphingobium endophyticum]
MVRTTRVKAPWYFWLVAVLSLPWNAFGCLDFTMTMTRNPDYLTQFPPEMIDFIDAFPAWAIAAWALGVWGSLAGSVLLLLRSRWAVAAFVISLLGLALSTVYQFAADIPEPMVSGMNLAVTIVIWIVAVALLWFSARMRARGVLR